MLDGVFRYISTECGTSMSGTTGTFLMTAVGVVVVPTRPPLFGPDDTLHRVEFNQDDLIETVAPLFQDLEQAYSTDDILVLKRFSTGVDTFADDLTTHIRGIERPQVLSLNRHAREILARVDPSTEILGPHERLQLVRTFLEDWEWEHDYLARAATKSSFRRDVGRLLVVLAWQGGPSIDPTDDRLAELVRAAEAFHEWVTDQGYLERGRVVSAATTALTDESVRDRVNRSYDAVLAIEFEEFARVDREYLAWLTADLPLTCLAEEHSSVQRVWNETGPVCAGDDIDPVHHDEATNGTPNRPGTIARYLATGQRMDDPGHGSVSILAEPTFEEQIRAVADEIRRLRSAHDWAYDDFAVGFNNAQAPIDGAVRLLQQAGIPTASVTVSGFSEDPSVRELYALASYKAGDDTTLTELNAAIPPDHGVTSGDIAGDSLEAVLWAWIEQTDLKDRIASEHGQLEARTQFRHVNEALELAGFLDASSVLSATWPEYQAALEELFAFAGTNARTSDVDVKEDGVLVDAVRVLKNASWKAVFLPNLVEGEYPSSPNLSALFPDQQLRSMRDFPGVTAPTDRAVRDTFPTAARSNGDPFGRYYTELSRRVLGVGARAAEKRLYFGVFAEESGGTGKYVQPSRFLLDLVDTFPWITAHDPDHIHGQAGAEAFALDRIDRALTTIEQAHLADEPIALDAIEADLASIQALLEAGGPRADQLRGALDARLDFATGRVSRE